MVDVHDPGGKTRLPLLPGVRGTASFAGERQEHRLWLRREWGDGPFFALWVGMNPSTAEADVDDLTVRKEQTWTRMMQCSAYVKVNVGSYRCTDPKGLARASAVSHPDNLPTILRLAAQAHRVVLATGSVPDVLVPHARTLFRELRRAATPLECLGVTRDGWPKHSSRLGYDTPIVEFSP